MKRLCLGLLLLAASATAQQQQKPQLNEDYTFNKTTFAPRPLHYRPDGNSAVVVDGKARFNRALYGAHTGFRVECSDRPEFGIYLPDMGGNLSLSLPEGPCEARYTPGKMNYQQGGIAIEVQIIREGEDVVLWRIENTTSKPLTIGYRFGGVSGKKFYRNGDLGVDDPEAFSFDAAACTTNQYTLDGARVGVAYEAKAKGEITLIIPFKKKQLSRLPHLVGEAKISGGKVCYMAYFPRHERPHTQAELAALFTKAEEQRKALTESIRIETPDPWLNPVGEALAIAADGIWSGRTWLHGSIGWRTEHLGWRGAYVGTSLGWTERARTHFRTYAANMVRDVEPMFDHPRQDSTLNLARAEKRWGTPMYSNGYICRRPGKREMSHYDMNLVYIDALLRHIRATGDEAFMREMFPTLKLHLEWEKRNFDPDGDHLYDGYCCIWASDALYYNGGAATHSSAYNYFANREMARIAERIGEDATPYRQEAEAIQQAMLEKLWDAEDNRWGEYRDAMGLQRLHTSPALWTIYHAIDSEVGSPAHWATTADYIRQLPHLPVRSTDLEEEYWVPATSDWQPYIWSINNVAIAEVMHAALAYWQAGYSEQAFHLMKGIVMDNMYLGTTPLNFGQISYLDAARGECYRDFADPIGVWSRALTEGLFGIRPDLIAGKVTIAPGFPQAWDHASIHLPKVNYSFKRNGNKLTYTIEHRYPQETTLAFMFNPQGLRRMVCYNREGEPVYETKWPAHDTATSWGRQSIELHNADYHRIELEYRSLPEQPAPHRPAAISAPQRANNALQGTLRTRTIDLTKYYNASVADIYRNEYLSPRPKATTLQIPKQGYGDWCHPQAMVEIDDKGLRELLAKHAIDAKNGLIEVTFDGTKIPFRLAHTGGNVLYTSRWDNYPTEAEVPLKGRGRKLLLMMAGSTNHMQSHISNGRLTAHYTDGTTATLELVNPDNWASIEQVGINDGYSYRAPALWRLSLENGTLSRTLDKDMGIEGINRMIPGGAATLVEMEIDPTKELQSLRLESLSNDVVIGLMGITVEE